MDVLLTSWQESEEVVEKRPPPDVVLSDLRPVPHPEAVLDEHEAVFVPHQVEQVDRITDDVEEEPRGQGLEALLLLPQMLFLRDFGEVPIFNGR